MHKKAIPAHYFPNREISVKKHPCCLSVTTGGTVYQIDDHGSQRHVPVCWYPHLRHVEVTLLDGNTVHLMRDGAQVICVEDTQIASAPPPAPVSCDS